MSKITLNNVGSLLDTTTAQTTINNNNTTLVSAFDNTLSRDGTSPNQMNAPLDMNSQQILNLPAPSTPNSPIRLQDFTSQGAGILPPGGTALQSLTKVNSTNFNTQWTDTSSLITAGSNITKTGTSPVTLSVSANPNLGTTTVTSNSALALAVGANGQTNPVLQVNASAPSAATGVNIFGGAAGNGVAVNAISSGTDESMGVNAKGAGTVAVGDTSTGGVRLGLGGGGVTARSAFNVLNNTSTLTSNSAVALAVGPNGTTNPTLQVNSSAASAATGVVVIAGASGNGTQFIATSPNANENIAVNAKGTGAVGIATVSTGGVLMGATGGSGIAMTSNSANALTVGPNGATNPVLQVNGSVASAATGVAITGNAAGSGAAIGCISSGTNENLALNAKGTGQINIGNSSTGAVNIGSAGSAVAITGTNTNNNAAAGIVGEYVTANQASPQSLTTATPLNVTSISLTAGDWDVSGTISFVYAATTVAQNIVASTNSTSATLGGLGFLNSFNFGSAGITPNGGFTMNTPTTRYSLSSTTTIYLIAQTQFTTSTATAIGLIRARRVR